MVVMRRVGVEIGAARLDNEFPQQTGIGELEKIVYEKCNFFMLFENESAPSGASIHNPLLAKMRKFRKYIPVIVAFILSYTLYGNTKIFTHGEQSGNNQAADTIVPSNMVEAELGDLGAEFDTVSIDGAVAITVSSELINSLVGNWTHKYRGGRIDIPVGVAYAVWAGAGSRPNSSRPSARLQRRAAPPS